MPGGCRVVLGAVPVAHLEQVDTRDRRRSRKGQRFAVGFQRFREIRIDLEDAHDFTRSRHLTKVYPP